MGTGPLPSSHTFFVSVLSAFHLSYYSWSSLKDTLVSGQLNLRPPCLTKPCLKAHTNSVFTHSTFCKRPFPQAAAGTFKGYDLEFSFVSKFPKTDTREKGILTNVLQYRSNKLVWQCFFVIFTNLSKTSMCRHDVSLEHSCVLLASLFMKLVYC